MKGIFTKTIGIIVFVVFLGIIGMNRVDAVAMSCYYGSEEFSVLVEVERSGTTYASNMVHYKNGNNIKTMYPVENYMSSHKYLNGVDLKDYLTPGTPYVPYRTVSEEKQCPTFAVVAFKKDTWFPNRNLYLSDSASVSKISQFVTAGYQLDVSKGDYVMVAPLIASTAEATTNTTKITGKVCGCENDLWKTKFKIADNGSLQPPKLEFLTYNGPSPTRNATIRNWTKTDVSRYVALYDLANTNACPNNILINLDSNPALLSYGMVDEMRSDLAKYNKSTTEKVSVVPCQEIVEEAPTVNPPVTKDLPTWEEPSINPDAVKPFSASSGVYSCGNGFMETIPSVIINATRMIYVLLQVFVPIALVLMGTIDLAKSITSQKEDEIKKGQQTFMKRLVVAAIVFFVFSILKLAVGIFSNDTNDIVDCMNCFLKGTDFCEM